MQIIFGLASLLLCSLDYVVVVVRSVLVFVVVVGSFVVVVALTRSKV